MFLIKILLIILVFVVVRGFLVRVAKNILRILGNILNRILKLIKDLASKFMDKVMDIISLKIDFEQLDLFFIMFLLLLFLSNLILLLTIILSILIASKFPFLLTFLYIKINFVNIKLCYNLFNALVILSGIVMVILFKLKFWTIFQNFNFQSFINLLFFFFFFIFLFVSYNFLLPLFKDIWYCPNSYCGLTFIDIVKQFTHRFELARLFSFTEILAMVEDEDTPDEEDDTVMRYIDSFIQRLSNSDNYTKSFISKIVLIELKEWAENPFSMSYKDYPFGFKYFQENKLLYNIFNITPDSFNPILTFQFKSWLMSDQEWTDFVRRYSHMHITPDSALSFGILSPQYAGFYNENNIVGLKEYIPISSDDFNRFIPIEKIQSQTSPYNKTISLKQQNILISLFGPDIFQSPHPGPNLYDVGVLFKDYNPEPDILKYIYIRSLNKIIQLPQDFLFSENFDFEKTILETYRNFLFYSSENRFCVKDFIFSDLRDINDLKDINDLNRLLFYNSRNILILNSLRNYKPVWVPIIDNNTDVQTSQFYNEESLKLTRAIMSRFVLDTHHGGADFLPTEDKTLLKKYSDFSPSINEFEEILRINMTPSNILFRWGTNFFFNFLDFVHYRCNGIGNNGRTLSGQTDCLYSENGEPLVQQLFPNNQGEIKTDFFFNIFPKNRSCIVGPVVYLPLGGSNFYQIAQMFSERKRFTENFFKYVPSPDERKTSLLYSFDKVVQNLYDESRNFIVNYYTFSDFSNNQRDSVRKISDELTYAMEHGFYNDILYNWRLLENFEPEYVKNNVIGRFGDSGYIKKIKNNNEDYSKEINQTIDKLINAACDYNYSFYPPELRKKVILEKLLWIN